MKTVVIHDSLYGNTKKVAQAIANAIPGEVVTMHVSEVPPAFEGAAYDLIIIGGPTHGGGPSDPMKALLDRMGASSLSGTHVAAFDTRITWWWLRPFGYAAPKIARRLQEKGGRLVLEGEGFYVTGGKGPMKEGELERAAAWAKEVAKLVTEAVAPSQAQFAAQLIASGG